MITVMAGIIGAAALFGLFTALRPRDRADDGCTGNCVGCTRNGACTNDSLVVPNDVRDLHHSRADSSLRSD